jgi:hypothetical protein
MLFLDKSIPFLFRIHYIQNLMELKDKIAPAYSLEEIKSRILSSGKSYIHLNEEDNTDEYIQFNFLGKYEGKEVVFDAIMYTLRFHHESELFEIAEHKAAQHFPEYKKITYEEDENGNMKTLDDFEEEIGLYMAEVIMELEEEGEIKVKEHVDIDTHLDSGIGLDIGLNVEKITPQLIEKFIKDFTEGTLQLDNTLYSFQTEDQEA